MKELTPEKKVHNLRIKLFLLILIISILLALGFHFLHKQQLKPLEPKVLGESIHSPPQVNIIEDIQSAVPVETIQNTFSDIQSQALEGAQNTFTSIASSAAQTVTNVVLDAALKPLIDKINTLPDSQKNEIKAQICR
jgi:hypothetical protein